MYTKCLKIQKWLNLNKQINKLNLLAKKRWNAKVVVKFLKNPNKQRNIDSSSIKIPCPLKLS